MEAQVGSELMRERRLVAASWKAISAALLRWKFQFKVAVFGGVCCVPNPREIIFPKGLLISQSISWEQMSSSAFLVERFCYSIPAAWWIISKDFIASKCDFINELMTGTTFRCDELSLRWQRRPIFKLNNAHHYRPRLRFQTADKIADTR